MFQSHNPIYHLVQPTRLAHPTTIGVTLVANWWNAIAISANITVNCYLPVPTTISCPWHQAIDPYKLEKKKKKKGLGEGVHVRQDWMIYYIIFGKIL